MPDAYHRASGGSRCDKLRDDFCIEHYANDPERTPAAKLITEILIPTG
jgi:DNA gyrase inhibitor GyrI